MIWNKNSLSEKYLLLVDSGTYYCSWTRADYVKKAVFFLFFFLFLIRFRYVSWYQSRFIVVQMSNTLNEREALDGEIRENNVITQAEFRAFQHETQQTLQAIHATLARLTTGNNQRREDKRVREDYREQIAPARERNPIPRR